MKIVYREHAKLRINLRGIEKRTVKKVLKEKDAEYFDTKANYFVAIKRLQYKKKIKPIAVVFEKSEKTIEVVTVFATKDREIKSRVLGGRWKHEDTIN